MTTARIEKDDSSNGLWMIIEHQVESTMWAIEADEVEAIRDAAEVWLERISQEEMKKSIK